MINKTFLKKYSKKDLKTLDDGNLYKIFQRRVWMKSPNKLGEEQVAFLLTFKELEHILKEAKARAKRLKKGRKKPLHMMLSHLTPELSLVLTERKL